MPNYISTKTYFYFRYVIIATKEIQDFVKLFIDVNTNLERPEQRSQNQKIGN